MNEDKREKTPAGREKIPEGDKPGCGGNKTKGRGEKVMTTIDGRRGSGAKSKWWRRNAAETRQSGGRTEWRKN